MNLSSVVLTLALLLSVLYVAMAFYASSHVKPEKRDRRGVNRLFALTLWWPFYTDLYDDAGLWLAPYGKLVLFATAGLYITHAVLVAR